MTEKDELTKNDTVDEPQADDADASLNTDDLDVEGALAALSSLQDLTRDDDVDDIADEPNTTPEVDITDMAVDAETELQVFERIEIEADDTPEPERQSATDMMAHEGTFPRPPVSVLHRGQLASVVPALLLMGIGGYLTFVITTAGAPLSAPVIVSLLVGGFGAMLLAQWISTSRWSIGSFFIGLLLLLTGGTIAYLLIPNQLSLQQGYPLIATAIGTAFVITDVFVPSGRRIWLMGLILAIGGLAGLLTTITLQNLDIIASVRGLWPIALVLVVVLLVAPLVRRRQ